MLTGHNCQSVVAMFLLRELARFTAVGVAFMVALSLGASNATAQDRRASVVETGGVAQAAVPGKRIALVIGNSRYATRALANAQHDAADVAARLHALGFDVVHLQDLDQAGMRRAVREFQLRTPGADVALFYFAGHGSQEHSRNYLWPIGAQPREIDDAEDELLPLNRVLDAMEGRARTSIVILDACRDAPLTGKARSNSRSSLAMDPQREGALIVYAAAPNKTASDGDGRNGVFTAAFLKALAGQDLSFNGVLRTTLEAMVADAKSKGQTPYVNGSELLRQRFRFDVTVEPGPQLREGQFWDSIKTSGDIADFEAYVKRYPKGEFVDLAANAIRRLKEAQAQQQAQQVSQAQGERERVEEARRRQEEQRQLTERLRAEQKAREAAEARAKELERQAAANAAAARPAPQSTSVSTPTQSPPTLQPGQAFRDCPQAYCPEMVVIPAGRFTMGSNDYESEKPPHQVSVRSFALGKYEVTQGQWKAVMGNNPSRFDECGDKCPVENVSWDDIQQYLQKLNQMTGQQYRLPSEAEWEYAARAGSNTKYSWGDDIGRNNANCGGCGSRWDNKSTAPVGSFDANSYGLHDMHGNVWEWVRDSYHSNYQGAPADGSAWTSGGDQGRRVVRGGSWIDSPNSARAAVRGSAAPVDRNLRIGFRVARTVNP